MPEEKLRKPYKELNQELKRTKRQSVNLGTVGLCAQGLDGPNVNRRLNSAPPGAGTVVTGRKADAGLSRVSR